MNANQKQRIICDDKRILRLQEEFAKVYNDETRENYLTLLHRALELGATDWFTLCCLDYSDFQYIIKENKININNMTLKIFINKIKHIERICHKGLLSLHIKVHRLRKCVKKKKGTEEKSCGPKRKILQLALLENRRRDKVKERLEKSMLLINYDKLC